jgi:tetratricopeptide (TPR) repeat protein
MLEEYSKKLQQIIISGNNNPETIADILQYITDKISVIHNDRELLSFYSGEKAFFQGQYEDAMRHYKKASQAYLTGFHYCRAAAFLLHQQDRKNDSITVIEKALHTQPNDYISLEFIVKVLSECNKSKEGEIWQAKLEGLIPQDKPSIQVNDIEEKDDIIIAEENIDEELEKLLAEIPPEDIFDEEMTALDSFPPPPPSGIASSLSTLPFVDDDDLILDPSFLDER